MTACYTGCRIRDEHLTDCAADDCKGCLPRRAEVGTLCMPCYLQLVSRLGEVPDVVDWLRITAKLDIEPSARPMTTDPVHRGDPSEGIVLPAAWLAADELGSLATSWALLVLEEHPADLRGPGSGDVVNWMLPHTEWIAGQEWACEMRRELSRDLATARARWPMPEDRAPDRAIPGVRCPRAGCGHLALRYYPPAWFRQPFAVACTECGRSFSEDEWDVFVYSALRKGAA